MVIFARKRSNAAFFIFDRLIYKNCKVNENTKHTTLYPFSIVKEIARTFNVDAADDKRTRKKLLNIANSRSHGMQFIVFFFFFKHTTRNDNGDDYGFRNTARASCEISSRYRRSITSAREKKGSISRYRANRCDRRVTANPWHIV